MPAGLRKSPVEVQQCPLDSRGPGLRSSPLVQRRPLRSGAGEEARSGGGGGRRRGVCLVFKDEIHRISTIDLPERSPLPISTFSHMRTESHQAVDHLPIGGFLKKGYPYSQIIHFNGIVHYKPSIFDTPICGNSQLTN